MNKEQAAVRQTYFSIIGNTCLAHKGLAGFFNSYALIADAIESTTDIFALLVIWNQVF
jgi:divalent metal cation (Fe/Co/Zn/Cd) transporter